MKIVYSNGEQFLDLEDKQFDFITSERLVKNTFRMFYYWYDECQKLQKENNDLKRKLEEVNG